MAKTIGVGEVKRRFSEVLTHVQLNRVRFIIERRGRPVAAIVSVDELDCLGPEGARPRGALSLIGMLSEYPEAVAAIDEAYGNRSVAHDRPVPDLEA